MIWYLLYPLRGTTKPPTLAASHPVRRAFYRHGKITAQHWLVAMLVSVAIAMGFSYPTVFLSGNPTAGLAAYPHHFWSTVKQFDGDHDHADMEMRQVWIHGSYMRALDKPTLLDALKLQGAIMKEDDRTSIIPGFDDRLRSGLLSWGYHSPLMYWNNSAEAIRDDQNVLKTIDEQSRSPSSLNVALRPASVFAGKKFDGWKLEAADALVITLMNRLDNNAGNEWQRRMQGLKSGACQNCTLFPEDGIVVRSRVYEFSFTPLSLQENLVLTVAYSCMALYVLLSLRRLKAFHSRFGLVVTAITQATCSILASITVCGVFKINLANIPQNVYPFVVLVVGLENMFRLINAIVATPATMATELRIANALGDVGPVSVATAAQNVMILSLLSQFVSPGVAAFCAFACIATLFDVFFLLTFFVAVLNVDIRRLELQDALSRGHQSKAKRGPSPSKAPTWLEALIRGRLPVSTRMAGTAVTSTFILSLNYHFFERHEYASSLHRLFGMARGTSPTLMDIDTFTPPPINATLTPGEWMRMQDFETAREVVRLAKPGADRFTIRVFAPLIVVLPGADRVEAPVGSGEWMHALRNAAVHHFYPLIIAVVFIVTFVAVLMSILLYSETVEDEAQEEEGTGDVLSVRTIPLPHKLDIVKLFGHDSGHFISASLDRTLCVTAFHRALNTYQVSKISQPSSTPSTWPIQIAAVDDTAAYLAYHGADDCVVIYDIAQTAILRKIEYPDDHPAVLFRFVRLPFGGESKIFFVLCTSAGRLSICPVDDGESYATTLSPVTVLGAAIVDLVSSGVRLIIAREDAIISGYCWDGHSWEHVISQPLSVELTHGRLTGAVEISMNMQVESDIVMVATSRAFQFLDGQSMTPIGRLDIEDDEWPHVRVLQGRVASCPTCGSLAYTSIGHIQRSPQAQDCQIVSLCWGDDGVPLCVRNAGPSCRPITDAARETHIIESAGCWQIAGSQSVLGLRKVYDTTHDSDTTAIHWRPAAGSSRQRRRVSSRSSTAEETRSWAAYKVSLDGAIETRDIGNTGSTDDDGQIQPLYVSTAGPAVSLQAHTIAVGFGNAVKIISDMRGDVFGRRDTITSLSRTPSTSRRRPNTRKA